MEIGNFTDQLQFEYMSPESKRLAGNPYLSGISILSSCKMDPAYQQIVLQYDLPRLGYAHATQSTIVFANLSLIAFSRLSGKVEASSSSACNPTMPGSHANTCPLSPLTLIRKR